MVIEYRVVKLPEGGKQYIRGTKRIDIPEASHIEEKPALSHDSSVTAYFGVVLDPSIAVAPGGRASVFVNLPIDTGIFATNGRRHIMIDRIDAHPKMFSLYGSASDGMIYRYFKTGYAKIRKNKKHTASTNITISNNSDEWKVASKLIFEARAFDFYKDSKGIVGEKLLLKISKEQVVTTKLGNVPSIKGTKLIRTADTLTDANTGMLGKLKRMKPDIVEMRYEQ